MVEPAPGLIHRRPTRPEREINRTRLRLPESLLSQRLGLAALVAPAGYGKSVVMADWQEQLRRSTIASAWLALRSRHRDPKTLLQDLITAMRQQVGSFEAVRSESSLRSATSYLVDPVLSTLVTEIEQHAEPIVLFLDDSENMGDSGGRDAIELIIEHRPDNLGIVLGSRDNRQFSFSRYRLTGQLDEIGSRELQFTEDEIRALLVDHYGIEVSKSQLHTLCEKTEGWAAALSLFAMGVRQRGQAGTVMEDFNGASSELADYLGDVLLRSLDDSLQDFLLRASVPVRFSRSLMGELAPNHDINASLQRVLDANLFLQGNDHSPGEYRFHALCGDFLRRRLRETNAPLYAKLLKQAGNWCWSQGQKHEAVECARRAEDWNCMAERILALAEPMVRSEAEFATFLKWVDDLPQSTLHAHPELYLHQAWAFGFSRRMAEAHGALDHLQELLPHLSTGRAENLSRQLEQLRFILDIIMDRGQLKLEQMQAWLKRYPEAGPSERSLVLAAVGSAARNLNQFSTALDAAEAAVRIINSAYTLSWVHNLRLSVLIKRGDFSEARTFGERALEESAVGVGEHAPTTSMGSTMMAYLAYEAGELANAREHLDNGLRFIANQGVVEPLYFAYLTQSYMAADDGNAELSLSSLADGEEFGLAYRLPRLTLQLATRRTLRYLHLGDQLAADAIIETRQLFNPLQDEFETDRLNCAELIHAHMELLRGQYQEAQIRLKKLSRQAHATGRGRMKMEYDFLLAVAMHAAGEPNEAGRRLRQLLAHAAVIKRYRFMLHAGTLARALVHDQLEARRQAWNAGAESDAADHVLKEISEALGLLDQDQEDLSNGTAVDSLTSREIDILKKAARSGLSNKKLAQALFVSEGTLKWHLHNIYSKLGPRNRAGAIAQAQRMGLLD